MKLNSSMSLASLNTIFAFYFFISEDFENIKILQYFAMLLFVLSCFSANIKLFKNKKHVLLNIDLIVFSLILVLFFVELSFSFAPFLFPSLLKNYVGNSDASQRNQGIIEYFNVTPYAKFKSFSEIHSAGDYGPAEKFEYSWKTDRYGFKNTEFLANRRDIAVLAIGDSFTEGMGVKVEQTYPSFLTELGIPTYNLGVQGSAPIQWKGYLELIGKDIKPKLVIVGYLPTVYEREAIFLNRELNNGALPSALGRIAKANRKHEIRSKKKFLISGLALFIEFNLIPEIKEGLQPLFNRFDSNLTVDPRYIDSALLVTSEKIRISKMARYIQEFKRVENKGLTKNEIAASSEWKSFEKQILEIHGKTRAEGANFLLIILPHRDLVYYEVATGNKPPEYNFSNIEIELLNEFSNKYNILTFDVTPDFIQYSNQLEEHSPLADYPYLEIDGHLSSKGNRLLAGLIKQFIINNHLLKKMN
jgi:hypothetical protein